MNETIPSLESYLRYFEFKNHLINFTSPTRLFPNYFIKLDLLPASHLLFIGEKFEREEVYILLLLEEKISDSFRISSFPLNFARTRVHGFDE